MGWGVGVSAGRGSGAFGAEAAGQGPGPRGEAGGGLGDGCSAGAPGAVGEVQAVTSELSPEGQGCFLALSRGWFGVGAEGCLLGGLVGGWTCGPEQAQ